MRKKKRIIYDAAWKGGSAWKTINGKKYEIYEFNRPLGFKSKSTAKSTAKKIKKNYYNVSVRVLKIGSGYAIYWRDEQAPPSKIWID